MTGWALLIIGVALFVLVQSTRPDRDARRLELQREREDLGPNEYEVVGSSGVIVSRRCEGCGLDALQEDGTYEGGRWLCADCLLDATGVLAQRRGNVIRLDDYRRRAS